MWNFTRRLHAGPPSSTDIRAAFKVLGLSYTPYVPQATLNEQVRKKYRELARLHHPDLSSGDDNRMKVINTAYELIQASGVLQGAALEGNDQVGTTAAPAASSESATEKPRTRFSRKAGSRRHRMPDDFASGDEESTGASSWSMKSSLDWQALMNNTETLTKEELNNPANHPFSHSRFFTFDEDLTVYKMIRGGATVPQVARTLGKPATFIEKRLHNAQFKLRVQYVLRGEKRSEKAQHAATSGKRADGKPRHGGDMPQGPSPAAPSAPNRQARLLTRSPYETYVQDESHMSSSRVLATLKGTGGPRGAGGMPFGLHPPSPKYAQRGSKRREWEPTMPAWELPRYYDDMTLEEKGRFDKILPEEPSASPGHGFSRDRQHPLWGAEAAVVNGQSYSARPSRPASKVGRSYSNYARLRGDKPKGAHTRSTSRNTQGH